MRVYTIDMISEFTYRHIYVTYLYKFIQTRSNIQLSSWSYICPSDVPDLRKKTI